MHLISVQLIHVNIIALLLHLPALSPLTLLHVLNWRLICKFPSFHFVIGNLRLSHIDVVKIIPADHVELISHLACVGGYLGLLYCERRGLYTGIRLIQAVLVFLVHLLWIIIERTLIVFADIDLLAVWLRIEIGWHLFVGHVRPRVHDVIFIGLNPPLLIGSVTNSHFIPHSLLIVHHLLLNLLLPLVTVHLSQPRIVIGSFSLPDWALLKLVWLFIFHHLLLSMIEKWLSSIRSYAVYHIFVSWGKAGFLLRWFWEFTSSHKLLSITLLNLVFLTYWLFCPNGGG